MTDIPKDLDDEGAPSPARTLLRMAQYLESPIRYADTGEIAHVQEDQGAVDARFLRAAIYRVGSAICDEISRL